MDAKDPTHKRLAIVGNAISQAYQIKAVLVVSACWTTYAKPCISCAPIPETLHDHPCDCLKNFEYEVPGCPHIAKHICTKLNTSGVSCTQDKNRGLDHGAWIAMHCLFPDSATAPPVCQLSLVEGYGTEEHLRIGNALDSL